MSRYLKRVERAETAFYAELDAIGEDIRRDLLIPFCDKRGWQFCAGMGSWNFNRPGRNDGPASWWDTKDIRRVLGARLVDALGISYGGHNDMGAMLANYTPTNYKDRIK